MVAIDIVLVFTLPFSKGQYFNFNPEPFSDIFEANICIPFIMSVFLSSISVHLKIPFTSTIIISVIVTIQSLSTIISNYYFIGIFPYHILNIIPALFIDQTVLKHNKNKINKKRITKAGSLLLNNNRYFIASTIISLFYIPLFFHVQTMFLEVF